MRSACWRFARWRIPITTTRHNEEVMMRDKSEKKPIYRRFWVWAFAFVVKVPQPPADAHLCITSADQIARGPVAPDRAGEQGCRPTLGGVRLIQVDINVGPTEVSR
jgi:hypothetical protein